MTATAAAAKDYLSESHLEDLLRRAFNTCGTTLTRQPLSVIHHGEAEMSGNIYERLAEDARILTTLRQHLSPMDMTLLNMAFKRDMAPGDIMTVVTKLRPVISQHTARTQLSIPVRFSTTAILGALRQANLFKPALSEIPLDDDQDEMPSSVRRHYYRAYRSWAAATDRWIRQAKKTAQGALSGWVV